MPLILILRENLNIDHLKLDFRAQVASALLSS
jgi:hypothetical protein